MIWLHGLGADGHDFEPIVPELDLGGRSVRFVFPHAPVRPVTLNGGMPMRAWFDILSLDRQGRPDEQGIRTSAAQVEALIQKENARGIPAERIVLAGFSQGGAIALHQGLRRAEGLGGHHGPVHLSAAGGQPGGRGQPGRIQNPLFMAHGRQDPVLPFAWGQQACDRLLAEGYAVQWHAYDMPHAVCAQEINDIGAWLRTVLPST